MKHKITIFSFASLFLLFSSCYDDLNNYTLNPINELTITTSTDSYAVEQLSELSIFPELLFSLDSTGNYSYEWKIFETREEDDFTNRIPYSEILATTRNLQEVIYTRPGEYALLYTVTDNSTGLQYFKELQLTINSGFYEGLVVAYNSENRGELGFIRADNEVGLNLMEQLNTPLVNEPILSANTLIVGSLRLLNITTPLNHYQIDTDNFMVLRDKSDLFSTSINTFGEGYLLGNKLSGYNVPSDIFYFTNGKVYADMGIDFNGAMANMYSQQFSYADGDYQLFPFVFNGTNGSPIYFYDNLNRRLLQATYNSRILTAVTRKTADVYDPATINKTAIAAMEGATGNAYYIMADDEGRYYLYTMSINTASTASGVLEVNLAAAPQFANATIFDARDDQRVIYYAVNNQLYRYNIPTNTARLVLSFSGNEEIADIQVYRSKLWQNSTNNAFNNRIYIATNTGTEGKVYQYTLLDNGDLNTTPDQEFTGFGAIVEIDYRNPNE